MRHTFVYWCIIFVFFCILYNICLCMFLICVPHIWMFNIYLMIAADKSVRGRAHIAVLLRRGQVVHSN